MDIVELIMTLEEGFGIDIADEEAERIATVGTLNDAILKRLPGADAARVWDALCETLVGMGAERDKIKRSARLLDLGC